MLGERATLPIMTSVSALVQTDQDVKTARCCPLVSQFEYRHQTIAV